MGIQGAGFSRREALRLGAGAVIGVAMGAFAQTVVLRDDGAYQDGGYWATPLPWLMETVMREDPARAARYFCEAVEDFQACKDINEWVNDGLPKKRGVRDYCASAAMPLAGARRLRTFLAAAGKTLPPELAQRLDTDEAWLKRAAQRVLRGGSKLSKSGVRMFTPDATGGYGAFWVRDWSYMIEGCSEAFTKTEIRDGYLFLAASQRADGCMPDRVEADGHGVYSPGGEKNPFSANGSVDQSAFMVIVCYQYWKLFDDLGPFMQTSAALEKAMRFTPRNLDNGLVCIGDAKLFRPYSFLDTVPLTGDQQFDSVLFWDASRKLAELFAAAGQTERESAWRAEAERVKASLSALWDAREGLFVAASERWPQPSIWGSLFAVYAGAATPEQTRSIVRMCLDHEDRFVSRGQIRHLSKGQFWGKPMPVAEQSGTWVPLFDGKTLAGWRPYGKPVGTPVGAGWKVEDGLLHKLPGVKGGDIVTVKAYTDFELAWEWRLAKDANNGVKYCVNEARPAAPGYEYQMIDDLAPKWNTLHAKALTASFYEVLPPASDKPLQPTGEWNRSRIVVRGNHVEHWLNGRKVLVYEFGSEAVKAGVADSKFKEFPDFGTKIVGPIMLTDHTDECWFRTIRVRELSGN